MPITINGLQAVSVYNQDIAGLHARLNRFIEELVHSVSGASSEMNPFDQQRLSSYLNAIRAYVGWVNSQPLLDLPETHPREYKLRPNPEVPDFESDSVKDVVRLMEVARDELIYSQSARDAAGMKSFDVQRLLAVVDKVANFLTQYIAVATPLDLPESSPMSQMTTPGRGGV